MKPWIATLAFALAFIAVTISQARAFTLVVEDLPGDIHEGGSAASDVQQHLYFKVSGFGQSKVTIQVSVNGQTSSYADGFYDVGAFFNPAPSYSLLKQASGSNANENLILADPSEIVWLSTFTGPQSLIVTFQAQDEQGNKSALLTRTFSVRPPGVPPPAVSGTIDRHPELKSRAVAWTEFDGAYLVDTGSRAEMLELFWNVLNKPYGDHGWSGSVNPPVAGTTSEKWRIREYAQLNAYRALNGSPAVSEDASKRDYVQAAALVFAQNPDKDLTHVLNGSYTGFNTTAADAAAHSLLNGSADDSKFTTVYHLSGAADTFVADAQSNNMDAVGHRMYLLHDNSISVALGSAITTPVSSLNLAVFANIWNTPLVDEVTDLNHFIAYPSAGYFPLPLIAPQYFKWSFVPADDWTDFLGSNTSLFTYDAGVPAKDATVTAKVNGVDLPVSDVVRNNPPGPLTWDFGTYLDFAGGNVADGTTVEITIHDVAILTPGESHVTGYRDYQYSVTLFDPAKIVSSGYSAKTPLVNLSTRSVIGGSDQVMIAGFSVTGTTPVRVAVRTQGPGLRQLGIQNAAKGTHIRVYDQATNTLMGENTGWKNHPNWRMLQSLSVAPTQDNEAGEVLTLWPGNYTAVVSDDTGANGIGIVEVFDIDNLSESRLGNLSARGLIGAGENQMIAGITLRRMRTIVIRTQGPGLARFGVNGVVNDTVLTVVAQNDGHTVAQNDDWQTDPNNGRLNTDLSSFAPSDPREAAVVLTLPAGAYTVLVTAKGTPGVGIVEVFDASK